MPRCDFCGKESDTVRRVVLGKDYDRLTPNHSIKWACPDCSEVKQKELEEESRI